VKKREHLQFFLAHVLGPLIVATRPHDLRSPDAVNDAARAWVLACQDVPGDVLEAGVAQLLGAKWMPRPGDLLEACQALIAERRQSVHAKAHALMADCVQCSGSGWETVAVDGDEYVKKCGCRARALALYEGVPEPLQLGAAPERGEWTRVAEQE
jgi:hypothetical protein